VKVYAYAPSEGLLTYAVVRQTPTIIVVAGRVADQVVARSDLDVGGWFWRTPAGAINGFLAKADAVLADPARRAHHAGWRAARVVAQRTLTQLPAPRRRSRTR